MKRGHLPTTPSTLTRPPAPTTSHTSHTSYTSHLSHSSHLSRGINCAFHFSKNEAYCPWSCYERSLSLFSRVDRACCSRLRYREHVSERANPSPFARALYLRRVLELSTGRALFHHAETESITLEISSSSRFPCRLLGWTGLERQVISTSIHCAPTQLCCGLGIQISLYPCICS